MNYRFGPNKPKFNGTDNEWNKLKNEIAWWNKKTLDNYLTVVCPHCGAKNTHQDNGSGGHRECNLIYSKVIYDCPGYVICKYNEK